jgi:hypothetical protein
MEKELTDFEFFAKVMPNYFVTSQFKNNLEVWRCRSNFGIEDEERWTYLVKVFQQRWPGRFIDISHNTYSNHVDFEINLKDVFPKNQITHE